MARYNLYLLFLVFLCSPLFAVESPRYQVLLHISENNLDKLSLALNNASAVQKQFGPETVEVEIVVYGPGVNTLKYYLPSPLKDKFNQSIYNGVRIVACENSMRHAKLRPSDMLQNLRYVPSGIAEIVEKNKAGWTYVRP